jgi:hypothetical protein
MDYNDNDARSVQSTNTGLIRGSNRTYQDHAKQSTLACFRPLLARSAQQRLVPAGNSHDRQLFPQVNAKGVEHENVARSISSD